MLPWQPTHLSDRNKRFSVNRIFVFHLTAGLTAIVSLSPVKYLGLSFIYISLQDDNGSRMYFIYSKRLFEIKDLCELFSFKYRFETFEDCSIKNVKKSLNK